MYFSTVIFSSALAFAGLSYAAPAPEAVAVAAAAPEAWNGNWGTNWDRRNRNKCLSPQDAQAAAGIFQTLIRNYTNEFALEALTEDFADWTSAVAIIRNRGNKGPYVVNDVTFTPRQAFMDAQRSQPPIPFDILNVFYGCNHTTVRWQTTRSANGQKTEANDIPVVGLAILETVPDANNSFGFRVKTLFSEFNAAAWLVNLGVFTPVPRNTTKRGVEDDELFFGI